MIYVKSAFQGFLVFGGLAFGGPVGFVIGAALAWGIE